MADTCGVCQMVDFGAGWLWLEEMEREWMKLVETKKTLVTKLLLKREMSYKLGKMLYYIMSIFDEYKE